MRQSEALRQLGLGVHLRSLREKSGMTTRSVASSLGVSRSSVSRTERGLRAPDREEVSALCALFGVVGDEREELLNRVGDSADASAWLALADMSDQLASILVLERESAVITNVELALIPGLLQTADYSRLVMAASVRPVPDLEKRVANRLGRQAILSRPNAAMVRCFVDEAALRRTLGDSAVMHEQLLHLLTVQRRSNVVVRVLPLSAQANTSLDGSFALYELPGGQPYVYVEAQNFGVLLTEAVDVHPFVETCSQLGDHALQERESAELINQIAEGLVHERAGMAQEQ